MAKTKMSKQQILDNLIKTCDYLIVPVAGVAAIWGYDISIYCAAGFGALASVLSFVKLLPSMQK
ncbi:MAG: hypothetical protein J5598_01730 [Clostridia bacterium]|nr:hypothetical protein [Clostridia bacterium]